MSGEAVEVFSPLGLRRRPEAPDPVGDGPQAPSARARCRTVQTVRGRGYSPGFRGAMGEGRRTR